MKRFVSSSIRTARRHHQSWVPSPLSPTPQRLAPLRQFVVAKSSKASKSGRFPPTPCTDNHPLQTATSTHANDVSDGMSGVGGGSGGVVGVGGEHTVAGGGDDAVAQLCADWRAAGGKPGATVMRQAGPVQVERSWPDP
jgi:hypothetical protein